VSLEFQFRGNSDVRSGIVGALRLIRAEKVKIPFDGGPGARNQFDVFNAGITNLDASAVLAVLYDCIVQIQFVLGVRHDIVSSKASEVKLAKNPELPVVIRLPD